MIVIDLLTCPLVQILIACVVTFSIFIVSFLRLYCLLTLGKCNSRAKMDGKTVLITGAYNKFFFLIGDCKQSKVWSKSDKKKSLKLWQKKLIIL